MRSVEIFLGYIVIRKGSRSVFIACIYLSGLSFPFCVAASVMIQPEAILMYRDRDMHHMGRSHGILDRSNSVSGKERAADFYTAKTNGW